MYRPICLVSSLCLTALPVKAVDNVLPMADFDEVKISVNTKNDFLASYMELNYPSSYAALAADVDCVACANGCSSGSETVDSGKCYTSTSSYLSCSTGQDVVCYNTANWCDHDTYPYTASNVPSNSTVSGTSCSGYIGASGGQCAPNTNRTYYSDFKCNNNYVKVGTGCERAYADCDAAGYYTDDNTDLYCEVSDKITLADGSQKTCYDDCHDIYSSCSAAGYDDPDYYNSCTGSDVDIYTDNLGTTYTCNTNCGNLPTSCENAGYKSSTVSGMDCTAKTVELSSGSKTCYVCSEQTEQQATCTSSCEENSEFDSCESTCLTAEDQCIQTEAYTGADCGYEYTQCVNGCPGEVVVTCTYADGSKDTITGGSTCYPYNYPSRTETVDTTAGGGGGGSHCPSADDCYSGGNSTDIMCAICRKNGWYGLM